jgi:predicted DsbA family dithiol-disulfide isomerase
MKIDFVSDVACPWCAVGLYSLLQALDRVAGEIDVDLRFEPFELNPSMAPEGEDAQMHLSRKYGLSAAQLAHNRQGLVERGASVGFDFGTRSRVWNTFDAHRLLHWAGVIGVQLELKRALLVAYHTNDQNPGAHDVLLQVVSDLGLDVEAAREVLTSGRYADEVRARQAHYRQLGINAVPSVIINDRHLLQGGQPPDVYEQALRQIAAGGTEHD